MLKGIDISVHQRNNYQYLIDNYATDFVITRAAWRYSVDSMCDTMYQYAKKQGKKLGFYFFPLTSDGSAEKHVEWAYNQVKGYIGEAIPILDWEAYTGGEGRNNEGDVTWALAWLKKFEELSGVKPMIYMNSNCERIYDWSPVVKNDNGLWIANYGYNNGIDDGRPQPKHWGFAAMHQYTSLGDNGRGLDRDTFYGDAKAWDAYVGKKKSTGNKKEPVVEKPVEKPAYEIYTVKKGDTLSAIAKKYGTTYQKIAKDNGIANPDLIHLNDKLKIYK